jgi:protein-disulfide isomerase-like protein with CxxC motif
MKKIILSCLPCQSFCFRALLMPEATRSLAMIGCAALFLVAGAADAQSAPTDTQIRQQIVQESVSVYLATGTPFWTRKRVTSLPASTRPLDSLQRDRQPIPLRCPHSAKAVSKSSRMISR